MRILSLVILVVMRIMHSMNRNNHLLRSAYGSHVLAPLPGRATTLTDAHNHHRVGGRLVCTVPGGGGRSSFDMDQGARWLQNIASTTLRGLS